jgi:hypothetical protein
MLGRVRKLRDPFTLDEARSAGVSFEMLRGKAWRRIGRGLYCSAGWREDSWQLLHAWHRHLRNVVFTGLSAAGFTDSTSIRATRSNVPLRAGRELDPAAGSSSGISRWMPPTS